MAPLDYTDLVGSDSFQNAETRALGLRVAGLVGRSIAEVRAQVDGVDCGLVVATEDVPPHVPSEVLEVEPDAHDGMTRLAWRCQTEAGAWQPWGTCGFIVDPDRVARHGVPTIHARLYTTRARATPGLRVRPIAALRFDLEGVCVYASDRDPERDRVRMDAADRSRATRESLVAKPRVPSTPDPTLDGLTSRFALRPPPDGITLDDWTPNDPDTGRFAWTTAIDDHRALFLMNARHDIRVIVGRRDTEPWRLVATEGATAFPPLELDGRGLRVAFRAVTGAPGPAFDVYAGPFGIEVIDGDGRRFDTALLVVSRGSPLGAAPSIALLAVDAAPSRAPAVVARVTGAGRTLELGELGPLGLDIADVRRGASPPSVVIRARAR